MLHRHNGNVPIKSLRHFSLFVVVGVLAALATLAGCAHFARPCRRQQRRSNHVILKPSRRHLLWWTTGVCKTLVFGLVVLRNLLTAMFLPFATTQNPLLRHWLSIDISREMAEESLKSPMMAPAGLFRLPLARCMTPLVNMGFPFLW